MRHAGWHCVTATEENARRSFGPWSRTSCAASCSSRMCSTRRRQGPRAPAAPHPSPRQRGGRHARRPSPSCPRARCAWNGSITTSVASSPRCAPTGSIGYWAGLLLTSCRTGIRFTRTLLCVVSVNMLSSCAQHLVRPCLAALPSTQVAWSLVSCSTLYPALPLRSICHPSRFRLLPAASIIAALSQLQLSRNFSGHSNLQGTGGWRANIEIVSHLHNLYPLHAVSQFAIKLWLIAVVMRAAFHFLSRDGAIARLHALQVCNHKFHNECLQRWADTSCPVCRYCLSR